MHHGGSRTGATVLLSSHILAEVEALCSAVTIVREGRTVRTGAMSDLRRSSRRQVLATTALPVADRLATLPGVHDLRAEGEHVSFHVESDALDAAVAVLSTAGVEALTCEAPSLEQIFLDEYESPAAR